MRARILRPEEWGKLDGRDLSKLLPYVEPENVAVCVVEDEAGEIIGCLAAIQVTHLEGTWIAPEHRGKAGALRALLRQAFAVPQARGERWAFGGTDGDSVKGFLERLGGKPLDMQFYALPTGAN